MTLLGLALLLVFAVSRAAVSSFSTDAANGGATNCAISEGELTALEALFNSTNGTEWAWREITFGSIWTFPVASLYVPYTDRWQGLNFSINSGGGGSNCSIDEVDLTGYNLRGQIPSELAALTGLTHLTLQTNTITGILPNQISKLTNLIQLYVGSNRVQRFPTFVTSMTNLQFLDIGYNGMSGFIPITISALSNLQAFFLQHNQFTSELPSTIYLLTNLEYLYVNNNPFESNIIPSHISNMAKLLILNSLDSNCHSTIPSEISHLTNLFYLNLNSNKFTNSLPSDLSSLRSLTYLFLGDNFFSGSPAVLGGITTLEYLDLNGNFFSGPLSESFGNLHNLSVMRLSNNLFHDVIPSSYSGLSRSLYYFEVSNNHLSGDPFFFLGFPKVRFANVSNNNFDDASSLDSDPTMAASDNLYFLDISNNFLSGSLAKNIGYLFPQLQLLAATNNCLNSYIPESLCNLGNLSIIIFDKLGFNCKASKFLAMTHSTLACYSIPSCLLKMPALESVNLVNNGLCGTIGEIGPNVVSLNLVGNNLIGTISDSIQQSTSLRDLYLAFNRISGSLLSHGFEGYPLNASIDLHSNRLSGQISPRLAGMDTINILEGNLFYCKDHPPSNDHNSATYDCGSRTIDFYQFVYYFVGGVSVLLAIFIWVWMRCKGGAQKKKKNGIKDLFLPLTFFRSFERPFPGFLFNALINKRFLAICLVLSLVHMFINIGMKLHNSENSSAGSSYGTHTFQFGWTSTFAYTHGIFPFVLVVLGLSVLLSAFLIHLDIEGEERRMESLRRKSIIRSNLTISRGKNEIKANSTDAGSAGNDVNEEEEEIEEINSKTLIEVIVRYMKNFDKSFLHLVILQAVNVAITTIVNIVYVLLDNAANGDYFYISSKNKVFLPILLSIFKAVWANTFVIYMIKQGIRLKLASYFIFSQYIFALVYSNVLVPIVTVFTTDVSCFYYAFNKIPELEVRGHSLTDAVICSYIDESHPLPTCPIVLTPIETMLYVTPAFFYSYQCGSILLIDYIPAILAKYTISVIFVPLAKLFLLSLPPYSWIRRTYIVKIILPFTIDALTEADAPNLHFQTYRYLSNLTVDVIMMFTYGLASPFLAFLIVANFIVNELMDHLQLGSYMHDKMMMNEEQQKKEEEDERCANSSSNNNNFNSSSSNNNNNDNNNNSNNNNDNNNNNNNSSSNRSSSLTSSSSSSSSSLGVADRVFSTLNPIINTTDEQSARGGQGETGTRSGVISMKFELGQGFPLFSLRELLAVPVQYLPNSRYLFLSTWRVILYVVLIFWSTIVFDMMGDIYGSIVGMISLLFFIVLSTLLFYSKERIVWIVTIFSSFSKKKNATSMHMKSDEQKQEDFVIAGKGANTLSIIDGQNKDTLSDVDL